MSTWGDFRESGLTIRARCRVSCSKAMRRKFRHVCSSGPPRHARCATPRGIKPCRSTPRTAAQDGVRRADCRLSIAETRHGLNQQAVQQLPTQAMVERHALNIKILGTSPRPSRCAGVAVRNVNDGRRPRADVRNMCTSSRVMLERNAMYDSVHARRRAAPSRTTRH